MLYKCIMMLSILMLVSSGCSLNYADTPSEKLRIHSESVFSVTGKSTGFEIQRGTNMAPIVSSRKDTISFLQLMGLSEVEAQRECNDPFVTNRLQYVAFTTIRPAKEIATFYENQFKNKGWKEVRTLLLIEETNGGGDWLRVYSKGLWQVHVHIIGPWEDDQSAVENGILTGRSVIFKFLNCTHQDVFGCGVIEGLKNIAEKGVSEVAP